VKSLVQFTRDLRVHDHPALHEACRTSDAVVPLFVLDDRLLSISPNRTRFLLEGLHDLDAELRRRFGRLVVRRGDPAQVAIEAANEAGCERIALTADVTSAALRRERELREGARASGIDVEVFPGHAVIEPGDIAPAGSRAYRVFTPYHRKWSDAVRRAVLPAPSRIFVPPDVRSDPIPAPASILVDASDLPPGGERAGRRHLEVFLRSNAAHYGEARDDIAADATSRLSPYLRFGFVSAAEVERRASEVPGAGPFVRQLAWRDFYLQLLADDPRLAWQDLRPGPAIETPLQDPEEALKLWKEGMTGLPLVDAGMRQLRREGWMHNRARMVVASFLTRRLGIPWQEGAAHFHRHLVDGDPANNAGGWRWTAGTGTDPRRSRTFNPVRQARRYDPRGDYVRRYVRELGDVQAPAIFAPWLEPALLKSKGYPEPLVPVRVE
jgi:deoxyribodipyrimidine photo-lyase